MASNNLPQLLTILNGRKVTKMGKELTVSAKTDAEREAAKAFQRVRLGTGILTIGLTVILAVVIFWGLSTPDSGDRRYGTVAEDGQVRYVQNTVRYVPLEQLGLSAFDLQPGDRVVLFFNSTDDTLTAAYPQALYEQNQNARLGLILGYVVFMCTALILYALVVCRLTPFGRPWYQYCKAQRQRESQAEKNMPLGTKLVIYGISLVLAILVCWPQIQNLLCQVRRMQNINELRSAIQAAQEAAEMAGNLDGFADAAGQNEAVEQARDAAEKIHDILDSLNGE